MAFHISPSERVKQFPDDLHLRNDGELWCIWCDRELGYRRKDGIVDHFKSKTHIRNKAARKNSASTSFSSDGDSGSRRDESLRKLFEESDSDSGTSFEGFDSPLSRSEKIQHSEFSPLPNREISGDDSRRSQRHRKRPAKLTDDVTSVTGIADQAAFISTMAKKRRTESEDSTTLSSPSRVRSMPIKKQLSYSARKADYSPPSSPPPGNQGSLKMKLNRKSGKQAEDFGVDKNVKVVSKPAGGKGLKLKFIWKKKHTSRFNEVDNMPNSSNPALQEEMEDVQASVTSTVPASGDLEDIVEEAASESQLITQKAVHEVPITPVKKSPSKSKPDVTKEAKNTVEMPATKKAKIKKTTMANDDKKKKVTAYMVWAKQMREKITRQYPGMEFADVSKKLGDMWKKVPDKAKQMIKVKNLSNNAARTNTSALPAKKGGRMIETGPKKQPQHIKQSLSATNHTFIDPESTMNKELMRLPLPSTEPLDSAAYFSLLGESFSTLSMKTKTGSQIQGADTVLLDSLLCAMVPLISLLRQIPELQDCVDQSTLKKCFSNIAHIVPGL